MTRTAVVLALTLLASPLGTFQTADAQPTHPVRMCAEWEPADGTLIRYPFGIPTSLVVELAADDSLFILLETQNQENQCRSVLNSGGVDLGVVRFIRTQTNSIWTRDWGPHSVFDGDGVWGITDPIFDGYPWVPPGRGLQDAARGSSLRGWDEDDAINAALAEAWNAPLHQMPAYCTGGNVMTDGHGIAFSTRQMVRENEPLMPEEEFFAIAQEYLGITDYRIMNNTEDYGIQHIDCWAKLLDPETILVKRPPTWHEEYNRIETNIAILEGLTDCNGRPYRIVRIDTPPYSGSDVAAYTNSLILNRKVLVPLFDIAGDDAALTTYRDAMPGYEVIGFQYSNWYHYDALHCRTMAIFDRHMLRIDHRPLDAEIPPAAEFPILVMIDDRSEAGLIEEELLLSWRIDGDLDWQIAPLLPTAGADSFTASIPAQALGTTIEYFLSASDESGRQETLPRVAPDGLFAFTVTLDPAAAAESAAPETARLFPIGPNPFTEDATIRFHFPATSRATLFVSDLTGRRIRTLRTGAYRGGPGQSIWDGTDDTGRSCAGGIYFIVLKSSDWTAKQRALVLR